MVVHSHLIKYKHYARHFYKIYWLFSFPSSWEVEVLCLRRENAGRIEVGCIRKLSGRAPTQNQVEAILKSCSITPHHIQILLPAPKEITFLCVSSCSCSIPTHSQNNPKPDSGFSATSLASYTVIFLEIDEWILKIWLHTTICSKHPY